MKLSIWIALFAASNGACYAQLPDVYQKISRITWVVKSMDAPLEGWKALGLSNVRDLGNLGGLAHAVSGTLGTLSVDLLQPAPGKSAFNQYLAAHGDGIFSIVYEVGSPEELTRETARLHSLGVAVLQTARKPGSDGPVFTYFDTEPRGKYVLGLVYWPHNAAAPAGPKVSHIAFVIRDPAPVSAYWQSLGFPAMVVAHASPRAGATYHGDPLMLPFDVGWHRYSQPTFEWIIPPQTPANCYADTLKAHGEGVHHLGLPVDDLDQAIATYAKLGHGVLQSGGWGVDGQKNSGKYAYMDTDAIGGVTVELIHPVN